MIIIFGVLLPPAFMLPCLRSKADVVVRTSAEKMKCLRMLSTSIKNLLTTPADRAAAMTHAAASIDFDTDEKGKIPVLFFWQQQSITFEEQVSSIRKSQQQTDVESIIAGLEI